MTNTTSFATEPVLFQLWHRPGKGHRWAKAGRYSTRAEALNAFGKGDWRIEEVRPVDHGGLFAEVPISTQTEQRPT